MSGGTAINIAKPDRIVTCPHGATTNEAPTILLWVGDDGVGVVAIYACVTCKDYMTIDGWTIDGRLPHGERVLKIGRVDFVDSFGDGILL